VTIHSTDPFATPEEHRSPVRRLRGRLPAPVTLWTAPGPVGLTVSSTQVVDGDPALVLGLLDPESDLWAAVEAAGVFAVTVLGPADRQLADRFAGLLPAPGGPFRGYEWRDTDHGPVLDGRSGIALCRLAESRPAGWSVLVTGTVEQVEIGDGEPLLHHRGRYQELRRTV